MKTAITSSGETLGSNIDSRFGRCKWFIIFDTETGEYQAVNNEVQNAAQGAGIQTAEKISRLGAEVLITGHCGPKAFRVLRAAGIKVYTGSQGTVAETLEKFKKGLLKETLEADVEGHWS